LFRKALFCVFLFGITLSLAITVPLSIKNATHVQSQAFAQVSDGNNAANVTTSGNNSTDAANQSNVTTMSIQQLDNVMNQLASSDKPDDIATLHTYGGFHLLM
jgi:acyl-CoA synthetase (AMP-forming)/AMP-acid ligase II